MDKATMKTFRKLLSFRNLLFILPLIACFYCKKPMSEEGVKSLFFTNVETEIVLGVGDEFQINYGVDPAEALFTMTVEWSSSDESVASVKFGKITANGLGTATITAKCGELTQQIVVRINGYSASSFTIPTEFNVFKDHKVRFPVSDIVPSQAKVSAINWKVEDPSMASIEVGNNDIYITGSKVGSTKLIAQSKDVIKECSLKVNEYIPVTAVTLTLSKTDAGINRDKINYTISYTPTNACVDKEFKLVFNSDAMVDEVVKDGLQGTIWTGQIKGNLSVYAEYGDGVKSNTVNVNLYKPVQYMLIEQVNTSYNLMSPDGSYGYPTAKKLVLNMNPTDANPPITYTSSNPSAVKVSADGTVTAVGHGVSEIKAVTPQRITSTIIVRSIKKSSIKYHYARSKDGSNMTEYNENRITTGTDESVFGDNEQLGYQDRGYVYWDPASYYKNSDGTYKWDSHFSPRNSIGNILRPTGTSTNSDYTVSVSNSSFSVYQQYPKLHKTNSIIKLYPPESTTAALTLDMSYGATKVEIGLWKDGGAIPTEYVYCYRSNNQWKYSSSHGSGNELKIWEKDDGKKIRVFASNAEEEIEIIYKGHPLFKGVVEYDYAHISESTNPWTISWKDYWRMHKDDEGTRICKSNYFYLKSVKDNETIVSAKFVFEPY